MLDDDEYLKAQDLLSQCFRNPKENIEDTMKPLYDWHRRITGVNIEHVNTILHHSISQYGPLCESCGKPYRTNRASLCAACGHKRLPH